MDEESKNYDSRHLDFTRRDWINTILIVLSVAVVSYFLSDSYNPIT